MIESRNLRVGSGELDLIVRLEGDRVAVEVKTVSGDAEPLDAYDRAKHDQVRDLAAIAGCDRVDVVGVRVSEVGVEIRWLPAVD